jgi:hypothetical protein
VSRTLAKQPKPLPPPTLAELCDDLGLVTDNTLLSLSKDTPQPENLNLVSGKRLAKWVQKNKVDQCQLIMINRIEDDVLCTTTSTEGSDIDKWNVVVPGDDVHSIQLKALLASKAHLCGEEMHGLPPARVPR